MSCGLCATASSGFVVYRSYSVKRVHVIQSFAALYVCMQSRLPFEGSCSGILLKLCSTFTNCGREWFCLSNANMLFKLIEVV